MNEGNLIQLKPGQVINPKGRGKGVKNRSTTINRWMGAKTRSRSPITQKDENLTQEDWIVIAMIGQARKGNVRAAEFLFDARYGALLRNVDPNKIPEDTNNKSEDFSAFTVVDPAYDAEFIELEIGADQ